MCKNIFFPPRKTSPIHPHACWKQGAESPLGRYNPDIHVVLSEVDGGIRESLDSLAPGCSLVKDLRTGVCIGKVS